MKNKFGTILLIGGVILALGFWYYLLFSATSGGSALGGGSIIGNSTDTFNFPYQSALDGSGVNSVAEIYPPVVGIMIDNHPDARDNQIELHRAGVVYEVPVEGAYTRYLALFNANYPVGQVGPVRSARPYFVDLLAEYGPALYLHSGGSPDALTKLRSVEVPIDINEFSNGQYFYRDPVFSAPHNLFTDQANWIKWATNHPDSAFNQPFNWSAWNFVTSTSALGMLGSLSTSTTIIYAADYVVTWEYNSTTRRYQRFENGSAREFYTAGTVILQYVPIKVIDEYGRKNVGLVGSGPAEVYVTGRLINGTWRKNTPTGRTKFYDALGAEIPFYWGPVWVEVLPAK